MGSPTKEIQFSRGKLMATAAHPSKREVFLSLLDVQISLGFLQNPRFSAKEISRRLEKPSLLIGGLALKRVLCRSTLLAPKVPALFKGEPRSV